MTTASDGKKYNVTYYVLPMVLLLDFMLEALEETELKMLEEAEKAIKWKNREIFEVIVLWFHFLCDIKYYFFYKTQ